MTTSPARNLLLITLDSVRADSFRGPVLDALKAEGTLLAQAVACAPSTPESHAAMFSGCYPPIHGLRNHQSRANDRTPHLLETLDDAGFEVAVCSRLTSMPARVIGGSDDIAAAVHALSGWGTERRHALFFHVRLTHFPYLIELPTLRSQPPTAIMHGLANPDVRTAILAGYEASIRCAETEVIARFADILRRCDRWDDTLLVLWSDHGEAFGAGGEPFHGYSLVDETLLVPVLMRGPGVPAGLVIDHQVRTIDIAPTVLELLGVPFDQRFFWRPEGESLVPWFGRPELRAHRLAYAECCAGGKSIGLGRPFDAPADHAAFRRAFGFRFAVRMPAWKLVAGDGGAQMFDLRRPDGEREAVDAVDGMTAADALAMLEHTLLGVDSATAASVEAGGTALLESLGYIDVSPASSPAAAGTADTALDDGDGLYPSYDLLWATETGHLASPRFLHHHDKNSHCELSPEHLYLIGFVAGGRTLRSALADITAALARHDAEMLRVFPQFALDPAQLAATLSRLSRQGFLARGPGGLQLSAGVELDVVEAVLRRPDDRLVADLAGLEAIALEHVLAGATEEEALALARAHAIDRLREEAREVLELAARRHLLRVRKAEVRPGAAR